MKALTHFRNVYDMLCQKKNCFIFEIRFEILMCSAYFFVRFRLSLYIWTYCYNIYAYIFTSENLGFSREVKINWWAFNEFILNFFLQFYINMNGYNLLLSLHILPKQKNINTTSATNMKATIFFLDACVFILLLVNCKYFFLVPITNKNFDK